MTKNQKILKDFMLGLIYPAVLGSILYFTLEAIAAQVSSPSPLTFTISVKFLLLFITAIFYVCDYLYITFTKEYRWWFFFCDLGFLITLYLTLMWIDLRSGDIQPKNRAILICYAMFLCLYWLWDWYEEKDSTRAEEKKHFGRVMRWEKISLMGIVAACISVSFWPNLYFKNTITLLVLAVITVFFVKYTYEKKEFYQVSSS